ncbi:MAG: hypothetical protein AB8H80_20590 [Planctomycetota bacterium]
MTSRDAVRLVQESAPLRLLGGFPERPTLRRELLLGVADGDTQAEFDTVDRWLARCFDAPTAVHLEDAESFTPIEILIDSFQEPTWVGFGRRDGEIGMLVDESLAVVLDAG